MGVRVHFGHFPVPRMACLASMYPIQSRDSSRRTAATAPLPGPSSLAFLRPAFGRSRQLPGRSTPPGPDRRELLVDRQASFARGPAESVPPVLIAGPGLSAIWVLHPAPAQPARKPVSACGSGWPENRRGASGCHGVTKVTGPCFMRSAGAPVHKTRRGPIPSPSAGFFSSKMHETRPDTPLAPASLPP